MAARTPAADHLIRPAPGLRLGWMTTGHWQARVAMFKFSQSRHNEE
jgi:hypothetical protein